ncbi:hypothetical protein GCM10011612_08670 [Actinomyces gaoshouyii]|uniref:Uncharacterized protein n=1 Tax=Actinomyces gaoshouyii TaxID=1960083 RepID=A0A8H9H856_9ACTO|nr:hypothetical protein GCM10011612_08670 [Actinomyces gaoshouyii]
MRELRTVDIRKNVEGAQFFLPVLMIGRAAGRQLDWREVHSATDDQASQVSSERQDFEPLHEIFDQIVSSGLRHPAHVTRPGGRRFESCPRYETGGPGTSRCRGLPHARHVRRRHPRAIGGAFRTGRC